MLHQHQALQLCHVSFGGPAAVSLSASFECTENQGISGLESFQPNARRRVFPALPGEYRVVSGRPRDRFVAEDEYVIATHDEKIAKLLAVPFSASAFVDKRVRIRPEI